MKRAFIFVPIVLFVLGQAQAQTTNAKPEAAPAEAKADAKAEPAPATEAKPEAAKSGEKPKEEPRVKRDPNGNVTLKVETEAQKLIALKVEPLTAAQLAPELKAYGRVLDPAPLAALMTELATAQAAYAVSSNELTRLKTLSTSGNASARVLQTAEAAAAHDRLTAQSARDRLVMAWGKWVVEQPDLPAFTQTLTALENALVRLDLSPGEPLAKQPLGARIVSLSSQTADAEVLGRALGVDPQTQGQGILLQIKKNDSRFLVGEAVTGFLKIPGEPLAGVIVPRAAVVRAEGARWVYLQTGEEQFTRKEIALDHPMEDGWFVTNGVAAGDKLVVMGAQTLFSEELKAASGPD